MNNEPQTLIRSVLEAFGSYDQAALVLNTPKSTVYFWARNKNIPHWRRRDILKVVKRRKIRLEEEQLAYLQSDESAKDFLKKSFQEQHYSVMSDDQQHFTLAAHPYNTEL